MGAVEEKEQLGELSLPLLPLRGTLKAIRMIPEFKFKSESSNKDSRILIIWESLMMKWISKPLRLMSKQPNSKS
jgi:hypothetical protein